MMMYNLNNKDYSCKNPILGTPVVTPETMAAFVLAKNPNPSDDILRIAKAFYDMGKALNIR